MVMSAYIATIVSLLYWANAPVDPLPPTYIHCPHTTNGSPFLTNDNPFYPTGNPK